MELRSGEPLKVGRALTTAFISIICILAILPQHTQELGWEWRLSAFLLSPPNEIGDTLAGIAGVLAFLWIIITVWLQSEELAEQRKELKATREEIKMSRIAQEKQVAALDAQAKVFEDEKTYRDHARAKELLDQKLAGICDIIHMSSIGFEGWDYIGKMSSYTLVDGGMKEGETDTNMSIGIFKQRKEDTIENYLKFAETSCRLAAEVMKRHADKITRKPKTRDQLEEICSRLKEIDTMNLVLSPDQNERVRNLRLPKLAEQLEVMMDEDSYWVHRRGVRK